MHTFDSPTSIGPDEVTAAAAQVAHFTDGTSAPVESVARDETGDLVGVWTVHGRYVPGREVAGVTTPAHSPAEPAPTADELADPVETDPTTPAHAGPAALAALAALDVDQLDQATRGLGDQLAEQIGQHVIAVRTERLRGRDNPDAALAVAEVAPLVRRLMHAGEVLRRIADEYKHAAQACEDYIADEATSTGRDRVAIPDDDGATEIVVAPKTRAETWAKPEQLAEVVAAVGSRELNVAGIVEATGGDVEAAVRLAFTDGTVYGFDQVERLGKVAWRVTDAQKFAASLMQRAEDKLAAAVERSIGRQTVETGDLVVKREAFKTGRRR